MTKVCVCVCGVRVTEFCVTKLCVCVCERVVKDLGVRDMSSGRCAHMCERVV